MENPTEFETFCYVLAHNPDDVTLNMKRRVMSVVMEKYNEIYEGGSLSSWAESVELMEQAVQANLGERAAEAKELGLEKGLKKSSGKGLVKGKRIVLRVLFIHKYEIDDSWANSLPDQQMDGTIIPIPKCDTYDDLKEKLKKNELE